jgi:putative oxidoreductase
MTGAIPAGFASELQSLARIIFGFLVFRHGLEQVFGFPAYRPVEAASAFGVLKLLCFPGGLLMMLGLFTRPVALVLSIAHILYWFIEPLPDFVLHGRRLVGAGGAPSDHVLLPGLFFLYASVSGAGVWSVDRLLGRDAGSAARNPADVRDAGSAARNPADVRDAGSAAGNPADVRDAGSAARNPADVRDAGSAARNPADVRDAGSAAGNPADVRDAGSATRNRGDAGRAGSAEQTRRAAYVLGVLRIVAGFLFLHHGIGKFIGPNLDPMSLRALAGVMECVGGPLLMAGMFTRPLAFLFSGEMAFAYFLNHAPEGFWGSFVEPNQEAAILNCFLFLFLWAAGPGAWSVDGRLERRRQRPGLALSPVS